MIEGVACVIPSTPNIDNEIDKVAEFIINREGKVIPIIYCDLTGWWTGYDYQNKEYLYVGVLDIHKAVSRRKFYLKFDDYETAIKCMYLNENKI